MKTVIEPQLKEITIDLSFFRKHCNLFPHEKRTAIFCYIFVEAWKMFLEQIKIGELKNVKHYGLIKDFVSNNGRLFIINEYPVIVFIYNESLSLETMPGGIDSRELIGCLKLDEDELPCRMRSSDEGIIHFQKTFSDFLQDLNWEELRMKSREKILAVNEKEVLNLFKDIKTHNGLSESEKKIALYFWTSVFKVYGLPTLSGC